MKKAEIISAAIFFVALTTFGVTEVMQRQDTDAKGPEITMDAESITVSIHANEAELLSGIQAWDAKDGDVTDSLLVESMGTIQEGAKREITIAAMDQDNHITKATREIVYSDYRSPQFSLSLPLKFSKGEDDIMENLTADDVLDGDLTKNIKISADYTVDMNTIGEYPVLFRVTNSAGDTAELSATVQVCNASEEVKKPIIRLTQYMVYTTPDVTLDPIEYVREFSLENQKYVKGEDGVFRISAPAEGQEVTEIRPEDIAIVDETDYSVPGSYQITYSYTDAGGKEGNVRLIVVVSE